jgi:hypothetical protein
MNYHTSARTFDNTPTFFLLRKPIKYDSTKKTIEIKLSFEFL